MPFPLSGASAAAATTNVGCWHKAEVFGIAAISSGYRGTFTVPPWRAGRVFMTRFSVAEILLSAAQQ
jgi:hypothetical protein